MVVDWRYEHYFQGIGVWILLGTLEGSMAKWPVYRN